MKSDDDASHATLIVGAGHCGERLAGELVADGVSTWATTRDTEKAVALEGNGVRAVQVDFDNDESLPMFSGVSFDCAVVSVPPSKEDTGHREARIGAWLRKLQVNHVIYWSATSVYPDVGSVEVSDDTPEAPANARGERRLVAERSLEEALAGEDATLDLVRIVGIYGPGRTVARRMRRGEYRYPGDGGRVSNRVHVDDVVGATRFILRRRREAVPSDASTMRWALSDGNSFKAIELIRFVSTELDLPMPPSVSLDDLSPMARSFWASSRDVYPRRLLELGWIPIYPTFREGLRASWAEEDA